MIYVFFFFFKQKTAYEMRISDWSSDVCSSDLLCAGPSDQARDLQPHPGEDRRQRHPPAGDGTGTQKPDPGLLLAGECRAFRPVARLLRPFHLAHSPLFRSGGASFAGARLRAWAGRSEEHTSELQSLMRLSFAVFCLKNKKIYT